jgi:hypothetical protein
MADQLSVEQQDHDAAGRKSVSNHKGDVARELPPLQLLQQKFPWVRHVIVVQSKEPVAKQKDQDNHKHGNADTHNDEPMRIRSQLSIGMLSAERRRADDWKSRNGGIGRTRVLNPANVPARPVITRMPCQVMYRWELAVADARFH